MSSLVVAPRFDISALVISIFAKALSLSTSWFRFASEEKSRPKSIALSSHVKTVSLKIDSKSSYASLEYSGISAAGVGLSIFFSRFLFGSATSTVESSGMVIASAADCSASCGIP